MSGPVFMYRKGEARLFASPDEIPADEGWVDSPAKVEEAPAIETSELDALREKAAALGIKVDGRWKLEKLRAVIAEKELQ